MGGSITKLFVVLMVICVQGTAVAAVQGETPSASLSVTWVDWPNAQVAQSSPGDAAVHRDKNLEREVKQELRQILNLRGIEVSDTASVRVSVTVVSKPVIEKYTDSLFGTVRNRPTKYRGTYTVTVENDVKELSTKVKKFSFDSGRTVGDTVAVARAKVRGMISRWIDRHIQKRKFRKHL